MKGKILACTLLLAFLACPLAQGPDLDDIYSIPEFDYVVDAIQEQQGEVFVYPACGLAKDARFYVMFMKGDEGYLATFAMSGERWEILEITLIGEKGEDGRKL